MSGDMDVYQGDNEEIVGRRSGLNGDLFSTLKKTLFVVGSAAVIFVALSNSLTYHLQNFWGASGNFWQHHWDKVLYVFGDNHFNLFVWGTTIVGYVVYWIIGLIYTVMDLSLKPSIIRRYKIQPGVNEPIGFMKVVQVVLWVHFNQIAVGIPTTIVAYYLFSLRGYDTSPTLPTFHWVLFQLVAFILLEEIGFYYTHRLFHHKTLYKHFHKRHHDWQAPIAITAIYAHPLEHVCSNLLPPFLGPFLFGSHVAASWLWYTLALTSTLNAHSGYHLPFFPSPEAHDFHHLKFNQCYGVLGILDFLHGTDDKFRASKCFSRHIMMLSLTPPREAFPDVDPEQEKKKHL